MALWERMLAHAVDGDEVRNAAGYRPGSPAHRARVRTWQALTALSPFLTTRHAGAAFQSIWRCIAVCEQTYTCQQITLSTKSTAW